MEIPERTLDGPESVIDALMDLMRVCDEEQEDFTDLLATAKVRYRAERYADAATREMARLSDEMDEAMREVGDEPTQDEIQRIFELAFRIRRYTRDPSPNFPEQAAQIARAASARFMEWNGTMDEARDA